MWAVQALSKLSDDTAYNRNELLGIFRSVKKDLNDITFRWSLYNLQKEERLFRTARDMYVTVKPKTLPVYRPDYSKKSLDIIKRIKKYNDLSFVVFESILLNEFLNHLIAQNTIYVQAEKEFSSYVFNILRERYENVLYKPRQKEIDLYWKKDCIVVLDLISQAPLSAETPHKITAEKMMIDIVSDKSIAATFSPAEIPSIYENIIRSYQLDRLKLNRYAGRRGKADLLEKYLKAG